MRGLLNASGSVVFFELVIYKTTSARYTDEYSHPAEPTATDMKADSHLQVDPSTVCVINAKSPFDHLVRESTGGHYRRIAAQELCTRSMENADGEVQTGATGADDCRRLDENACEQYYDAVTVVRWGLFNCR